MEAITIISLIVSALMLGIGIRLTFVSLLWKKVCKQQQKTIELQGEIIYNNNKTISYYKRIFSKGVVMN
jgi:hypothetical protein